MFHECLVRLIAKDMLLFYEILNLISQNCFQNVRQRKQFEISPLEKQANKLPLSRPIKLMQLVGKDMLVIHPQNFIHLYHTNLYILK